MPLPPRRWGPLRITLASIILICAVIFLYRLLARIGPQKVFEAAVTADPLLLLLTLTAVAGRFWVWSLKWSSISRRLFSGIRATACFPCLLCGSFADLVTPFARTAGGFIRCYLLASRCGLPALRLYGTTLRDQLTNVAGVWLVSFAALAAIPLWYDPAAVLSGNAPLLDQSLILAFLGLLGLTTLLLIIGFREAVGRALSRPDYTRLLNAVYPLARWLPRVRNKFSDAASFAAATITRSSDIFGPMFRSGEAQRMVPRDVAMGGILWLCLCTGNYLAFRACGARPGEVPLLMVVAILSVGNLAGLLSTIPGGIGVTEASLISLHMVAGVRPELAAAANLLFRLTFYFFVISAGALSLTWASRTSNRNRENTAQDSVTASPKG